VQVQNLPRTYTEPLEFARELVKGRKLDALRIVYGSPNDTLSQLIRTAFVAAPGNVLIDADFSAIEARVISWLADEEWRLEVFRTHGKIYEASASQMFGVPLERIKKGNPEYSLRQRGKVAELALGYQGGVPAMRQMDTGKLLADLPDEEIKDIVDKWRNTNPKIRNLWYSFNDAAIRVIQNGGSLRVRCCTFARECDCIRGTTCMTISLPSGRKLYYVEPAVGENRWGGPSITYMGVNDKNKWGRIETYGGKLVENVVQAIARDCLAQAIEHLEAAGLPVVFHIHDEVVIDTAAFDTNDAMLDKVVKIMSTPIPWAEGLHLGADGWVGAFFKKD
jgi:DNA polymerase